ncbi:hypothetical protein ASD77_05325 [Pseudoxanthomonas sp. Root65]|uniref:hypothetical protein n=1 Tax=Pseudoxanthomonas sp. Root65 TaxID=1736576 RepID=UPI0006F45BD2|nr:hypothetical protein [Pseudoxanthomonas sp. Root65]KRA54048.1 hypothetical protein ASD77_05325 [Pseudoxanthomonas sp. Root65]
MIAILLLVLLIGLGVMTLIFLLAARGATRKGKWLGLAAIILAAPFFFWLGAFSEQFTAGQCYSSAIHAIANAVAATDEPAALAEKIRALPLHGYETSCVQVEAAAVKLPRAGVR